MTHRETKTEWLVRELVRLISSGRYSVGTFLPTEHALCRNFGLSRVTVRRALGTLLKMGIIYKKPGVGTKIISLGTDVGFSYSLSKVDDLDQLAKDHQRKVLSWVNICVDEQLSNELGYPVGKRLIRLSNVRLGKCQSDPPIVFTYVYFEDRFSSAIELVIANPEILAVHLVEDVAGTACMEVRQSIHAVSLSKELSTILKAPEQSPALMILRRYVDKKGNPIVISQSWHPGSRYAFSLNIKKNH